MLSESEVNMVVGCVLRKRGNRQPISSPSQDGKGGGDSGLGDSDVEEGEHAFGHLGTALISSTKI
jgi:hypothetical protein